MYIQHSVPEYNVKLKIHVRLLEPDVCSAIK